MKPNLFLISGMLFFRQMLVVLFISHIFSPLCSTLSPPPFHNISLTHTLSHSLPPYHALPPSLSHTPSLSHMHTLSISLPLTIQSLSLSLYLSLSLPLTCYLTWCSKSNELISTSSWLRFHFIKWSGKCAERSTLYVRKTKKAKNK